MAEVYRRSSRVCRTACVQGQSENCGAPEGERSSARLRVAPTLVSPLLAVQTAGHFRATEQWFVSMETNELRQEALAEIDRVRWIPTYGRDRINGMIENRPDWCLSRQRVWGTPIPGFTCVKCGRCWLIPGDRSRR